MRLDYTHKDLITTNVPASMPGIYTHAGSLEEPNRECTQRSFQPWATLRVVERVQ